MFRFIGGKVTKKRVKCKKILVFFHFREGVACFIVVDNHSGGSFFVCSSPLMECEPFVRHGACASLLKYSTRWLIIFAKMCCLLYFCIDNLG